MFESSRPAARLAGAAVLGFALATAPVITALTGTPLQSVAEPACTGSESIVDGTPTCVPAPLPPEVSSPQTGSVDSQQQDGGHH